MCKQLRQPHLAFPSIRRAAHAATGLCEPMKQACFWVQGTTTADGMQWCFLTAKQVHVAAGDVQKCARVRTRVANTVAGAHLAKLPQSRCTRRQASARHAFKVCCMAGVMQLPSSDALGYSTEQLQQRTRDAAGACSRRVLSCI